MSMKEGLILLNSDNILPADKNEHKVERLPMISRNFGRKGLRNITNLPQPLNPLIRDEKSEECINKLKKENMTLVKLLADRDKIIELSGIELQKLKAELRNVQQQNVQLAQSNTQMLVELNSRKDRLKLLQHELGCKQGLLVAKNVELEVEMPKCKKTSKFSGAAKDGDRLNKINRNQPSKSLASLTFEQPEDNKNEKRLCVGSQCARFKSEETGNVKDLLEVDSSRFTSVSFSDDETEEHIITSNLVDREDTNSDKKSLRVRRQSARFTFEEAKYDEDTSEVNCRFPSSPHSNGQIQHNDDKLDSTNLVQDIGRLSIGRPSRQVANKVSSYKEVPTNAKMRR